MNRRRFIRHCSTALAAGPLLLPSRAHALGYPANERLRLAVFGNFYNAPHFLHAVHEHDTEIVALAEVDERRLEPVFERWRQQAGEVDPRYRALARREGLRVVPDLRQLFDGQPGFDALVVAEQDHLHGFACGLALRAGLPVCNERPLGRHPREARALRALAATTGLPTCYRSPGTASGSFRHAAEMLTAGVIGEVREVHVWFDRAGPDRDATPSGGEPVPDGLDWDSWLGPLPWREHHGQWRSYPHWRETSAGGLGVFGPHTMVFPFFALRLGDLWAMDQPGAAEIEVSAEVARHNPVSFPSWERVRWRVPAREGGWPELTIHWHHGADLPPDSRRLLHRHLAGLGVRDPAEADDLMRQAGSLLLGSEGAMLADDHSTGVTLLPTDRFDQQPSQPESLPRSAGLYRDWLDACRGGERVGLADFELAGPLSELLMLGNLATLHAGDALHYRPADGRVRGPGGDMDWAMDDYRDGWPPPW